MGDKLSVRDETVRCYSVELKSHGVLPAPCSKAFPKEHPESLSKGNVLQRSGCKSVLIDRDDETSVYACEFAQSKNL
jgi:hypothetical protein